MELCETARNYKDAYELLEQELFEKYQICKYSSYESFRDAKSKYFNIPKIIK
jgi:hypothetical protein